MEIKAKDKTEGYTKNKGDGSIFIKNRTVPFILLTLIFSLSFLFINYAAAEVTVLKNSLIWSQDGSGSYLFPKLENNSYVMNEAVLSKGQITGITANWESIGKITLEVSADNGLHFTPVINGVPLTSGFSNGNQLRWRAQTLSGDAKLSTVKISYTDTTGVSGNFGEPILSGFKYRKAVSIKNSSDEDLYNYQMKLKIGESAVVKTADVNCDSGIQADFKDIRFTATDMQTPLAYYLESLEGAAPDRTASVWVKVAQIPKKSTLTIYLYYGNADAQDLSSPDKAFDFFEDFKAKELDKNKWVTYADPKGSVALNPGQIKLDAAEIITKEFKFKEGIIEYLSDLESGFENSLNIRNKNDNTYDIPAWGAYSSIYKGAEHCLAINGIVKANDAVAKPTVAGKYNYRLSAAAGKITFERFDAASGELQASVNYQASPEPQAGFLGIRSGGDGNGKNIIYLGTIRARKLAQVPPTIEGSGKVEAVDLPVFINTEISAKGNLVLKAETKRGYYISRDISTVETARIIVPSWQRDDADRTTLAVGISTDKGLTYKSDCDNGKFYYASKKDFSATSNLKARIDFFRSNTLDVSSGLAVLSLDARPGKINIVSPNAGEKFSAYSKQEVTWVADEYAADYLFRLEFSADGGRSYAPVRDSVSNTGKFLWKVPNEITSKAKIKISDTFNSDIYDTSDKNFSIIEGVPQPEAEVAPVIPPVQEAKAKETPDTKKPNGKNAYELLIKVKDNYSANPKEDAADSFKEGDVVRVEPAGFIWGAAEKEDFLIVPVYLTAKEAVNLTQAKFRDTGKVDKLGRPVMEQVARRSFKLDLEKLGVAKKDISKMREAVKKNVQLTDMVEKNE